MDVSFFYIIFVIKLHKLLNIMKKLNLIKILKDCPKGTKFYSPVYGKIEFIRIETFENNPDPITIKWFKDENTTYLEYLRADGTFRGLGECIIFPSEEQRDWSKWQRPFVKGDVLVSEAGNIVLCSHIDEKTQLVHYHCILNFLDILKIRDDIGVGYSYECTLANDFQKQKLFDALKKEGYEWDAEKKELKHLQQFKDGDIIYNRVQKRICICHYRKDEKLCVSHCRYNVYHKKFELLDTDLVFVKQDYRLATDEEKQILFDAIKKNGYKWNDKTKTLEKLIVPKFKIDVKEQDDYELVLNKFDISTLIPYESKVLIRNTKSGHWQPAFWGAYIIDHSDGLQHHDYLTTKGFTHYCIPYEGNEHLIGTTDDCDEYYKTWEE